MVFMKAAPHWGGSPYNPGRSSFPGVGGVGEGGGTGGACGMGGVWGIGGNGGGDDVGSCRGISNGLLGAGGGGGP